MHTRAKLGYMLLGSMDDIMNRLVILLTICGLVISGCSETVDSTYNVPTLHLVLDSQHSSEYPPQFVRWHGEFCKNRLSCSVGSPDGIRHFRFD